MGIGWEWTWEFPGELGIGLAFRRPRTRSSLAVLDTGFGLRGFMRQRASQRSWRHPYATLFGSIPKHHSRLHTGRQRTDGAERILLKDELDRPGLCVEDVGVLPDQPVCRPEQIMEKKGAVLQRDRALVNLALPGNTVSTDVPRKFGFGAWRIGRETQLEEASDLAASPSPVAPARIDDKFAHIEFCYGSVGHGVVLSPVGQEAIEPPEPPAPSTVCVQAGPRRPQISLYAISGWGSRK
jgi:hypothetical protein